MESNGDFHSALANLGSCAGLAAAPESQQVECSPPFYFSVFQPTDTFEPVYEYQYDEHLVQQIIGKGPLDQLLQAISMDQVLLQAISMDQVLSQAISMDQPTFTSSNGAERMGPRGLQELGEGYLNDSFVDDTAKVREAIIPEGYTTQHGGHYFGSGPLSIRPLQPGEKETHVYATLSFEDCKRRLEEVNPASSDFSVRKQGDNRHSKFTEPKKKRMRKSVQEVSFTDSSLFIKGGVLPVAEVWMEQLEGSIQHQEEYPQQENLQVGEDQDGPVTKAGSTMRLPDELPGSLQEDIGKLKKIREEWTGTKSQFLKVDKNPELDIILLRIEYAVRALPSNQRSNSKFVYDCLAQFMQCTRKTIMARARKIRREDVDKKSDVIARSLLQCLLGDCDAANYKNKARARELAEQAIRLKLMAVDLYKDKDRKMGTRSPYLEEWFAQELWQDILCQPRCGIYGLGDILNSFLKEAK